MHEMERQPCRPVSRNISASALIQLLPDVTLQALAHLADDVFTAAAVASRAQHTVPCCSRISGGYCADGHLVSRGAAAAHLQRRPDLMNRVSRLLQPGADLPSDAYYCILGAPNSGKTHIVRKACEEVRALGPTVLACSHMFIANSEMLDHRAGFREH